MEEKNETKHIERKAEHKKEKYNHD